MLALDMHDGPAGPPIGAAQLLRRQTSLAAAGWDLVRDAPALQRACRRCNPGRRVPTSYREPALWTLNPGG
ncbi:hypothetical protein AZ28_2754 [Bordetella pertussis B200]|nr:hypothetical protein AZ28_2754 [Bordetella pertussis B200]